ncbi:MAG TPA: hypothetical protein DCL54_08950, partial [Alphaproteobacteria bacterium]|nr:hypothetical protein [Alphaproteobacteria bacterium]
MPIMPPQARLRATQMAVTLACLVSLQAAAMAQPADVIESISRGDQAGRAIEQVRERLGEPQGLLPDIGGDPGVYVLIEEDIFSVAFDVGLGHTNEVDKGDLQEATSAYTTLQFDIGVDTRIADSINAGARLALSETIYHAERGFDSAALIGSLYVSEPVWGGVVLTADVTGGLNGGYDFDNGSAYVNGSLRAARPIVLDEGVVLIPVVFAGLVFAEQSEQDRWE